MVHPFSYEKPATIAVYTDGEVVGDGVVKLPFAAALKSALPQARLTWVCGGKTVYTDILADIAKPFIDEILLLPTPVMSAKDLLRGALFQGRRFDLVIDTQRNLRRTLWLKYQLKHRVFASSSSNFLLSNVRQLYREESPLIFRQLMCLGSSAIGERLTASAIELSENKWAIAAQKLLPDGPRYIGFVVGAGHPKKRWPLDRFIQLAKLKARDGFIPVFFLGPAERDLASAIHSESPTAILPLTSPASVDVDPSNPCLTIALASRLKAAVANDSGGGHLVAAGAVPMVSLFRSSSVRRKFTPAAPRVAALAPEDFGGERMDDIPLHAVQAALNTLLS